MDNLPQNLKSKLSQTGHGMHCREIMFTPRCSTRAVEFQRSVNFFCTTYGFGATGRQSCPIVGLFSPYKTPETYLPVTSLQPRGYVAECLRFFHVVVEDPKGYRPAAMLGGEGKGTPQEKFNKSNTDWGTGGPKMEFWRYM